MISKIWKMISEAVGIEVEGPMNFQKLGRKRNMDRYGTMDRRTNQGPMPYFKPGGKRPGMQQQMQQKRGIVPQIPDGSDVPGGQGINPLTKPSPMSTQNKRIPQPGMNISTQDWSDMMDSDESSDEEF